MAMRDPSPADFFIKIDFAPGEPDPGRVFRAAQSMIDAFDSLDHELVSTIDSHIKPILVLEDIEAGSLKIWLRNFLEATDDEALRTLDWKPQVGKYLVRAKRIVVDMLDGKTTIDDLVPFREMGRRIRAAANETGVRVLGDYTEPSLKSLIDHSGRLALAQQQLGENDKVSIGSAEGEKTFSLTADFAPEKLEDMLIKETSDWPAAPMILRVKRPDYLGRAKWEFRHGRTPVHARIDDEDWLRKFQTRHQDANVRPGDSLRCMVRRTVSYGYDGDIVRDLYIIEHVVTIIEGAEGAQMDAFDDPDPEII